MPMDVEQVLNYKFKTIDFDWDADKVILYHLGLGAGADWLNPDELRYTYEKNCKCYLAMAYCPHLMRCQTSWDPTCWRR